MELPNHIEKYLGEMKGGDIISHPIYGKLSIVYFDNQPNDGIASFLTLGLSDHVLYLTETKDVRVELILSLYNNYPKNNIFDVLLNVSEEILIKHKAPLRGHVIKTKLHFLTNFNISGFYITHPVFFEEDFWVYENSEPSTVFLWLIPVNQREIDFIESDGWEKFEDLLEEKDDCDFWDLNRKSIV
ncbi:suppressor of fused domain protein [Flavobacterium johnsoniae]|uniref:suppressor of fused domain protein n=1 Tax=Flavobacterium johnsoniae TaxID=986 RepID=UPI003D97B174